MTLEQNTKLSIPAEGLVITVEDIARIAHEVNAAYCLSLGDSSQLPWDQVPADIKASAVQGVIFHLENQNSTPDQSHQNWLELKLSQGWVYGEEKNPEMKTHPCCVPYEELPQAQRSKDFIFGQVVKSIRRITNF